MTRKGRRSEQALLEAVREAPGLSLYELAGVLKWTIGRVHGTAKRLLNSNQIYIEPVVRKGSRAHLVYPEETDDHACIMQAYSRQYRCGKPRKNRGLWR